MRSKTLSWLREAKTDASLTIWILMGGEFFLHVDVKHRE